MTANNDDIRPIVPAHVRVRSQNSSTLNQGVSPSGSSAAQPSSGQTAGQAGSESFHGVPAASGASGANGGATLAPNPFADPATPTGAEPFFGSPASLADESSKQSLIVAVREIENKSTGWFTKLMVLAVSLAVFVAMGLAWWDLKLIGMLVIVLLIHELGHYVAMRVFGYRNVKMFFIPLLGAAVSGRHFNISGWKKALVYLAGPVPGILLSLPMILAGMTWEMDYVTELGGLMLVLNALNLLPLMPLDGGWIMHLTVFSRSPLLELAARIVAIVVMIGSSFFMDSRVLMFLAIPLVLSLPTTFRVAKLIRSMRDRPLPPPEEDEIPDEAIRLIADEMRPTPLAAVPTPQKAGLVVQVYESLIVRPPGVGSTLAIWFLYFGSFAVAIFGGIGILAARVMQDSRFFDDPMFDSVQHEVVLEVNEAKFHLGSEPIGAENPVKGTELAIVQFASVDELDAAIAKLDPDELERNTHARMGTVLLASVPTTKDPLAEDDEEVDEDFDAFTEKGFRERMLERMRTTDPVDTWLAPLTVEEVDFANDFTEDEVADQIGTEEGKEQVEEAGDEESSISLAKPTIHVIGGLFNASVELRCIAPSEEVANEMAQSMFQMPVVTSESLYIPQWSPIDPPSQSQIACRQVLKRLVNGITEASSPELWERRQTLANEYSESRRGKPYDPKAQEQYQADHLELQQQYFEMILSELADSETEQAQAEVAQAYIDFQKAQRDFQTRQTALSAELDRKEEAGELSGDALEAAREELYDNADYPELEKFLAGKKELLGFAEPGQRHFHFAAHVSGYVYQNDEESTVESTEELLEAVLGNDEAVESANADLGDAGLGENAEAESEPVGDELADTGAPRGPNWVASRLLQLHIHRAKDHTATVSALVAYLKKRGCTDFELRFSTSKLD